MSVYFYGCISIDGYLADKNHNLDWLYETGTPEETDYNSFYQKIDITLMGRKTFDEIAKMDAAHLAYPTSKNYVFTHAQALPVSGYSPVSGDVVAFVKSIPKGKNIWVVGGNSLLAPLLDNDMIDTMIIQIAPVLLGGGIPLFTQKDALKRFRLEKTNRYGPFAELIYHIS